MGRTTSSTSIYEVITIVCDTDKAPAICAAKILEGWEEGYNNPVMRGFRRVDGSRRKLIFWRVAF